MKRLLLTAYGLCTEEIRNTFLKLIPKDSKDLSIAIISTSQPKLKDKHPQMVSVKNSFHDLGFTNVEFIDIEFEDKHKLRKFDVIFLNGGYPFYLIYHLKKSGADIVLNELIDNGKIVIGLSAGSIALGPDNAMCNYIYPEDNTFSVTDLSALNAIDIRIYPHYKEHCGLNSNLEGKISNFEEKYNCKITRLNNDQAILVLGDNVEKIG
jgi:dipeptidase E